MSFIFASRLGHKTVRTTRFHIQTKYNEVSKVFFTSLGSNEGWKISIQTNFLNSAGNLVQLGALF